jgi:hypothetical protein
MASMVGGGTRRLVRGARHGATQAGSQLGWLAELEGLRKALTEAEFESAKRHLLAG